MTSSHWVSLCKGIIYVGLGALLFTPFIVTNSLYFPYITGKAFYFRIIIEIIFATWLVLALLDPAYRPRRSWIVNTFVIFLGALFISNMLGVNQIASFWSNLERMEGYVTIVHLFLLVLVAGSVLRTAQSWSIYFHIFFTSSIFMVISALNQIAEKGFAFRIDTTLGNPIYLAVYMLFGSFISLWLIAQLQKNSVREYATSTRFWLYSIVWLLQIIIIIQTQTRGAMLGLFGGLLCVSVITAIFENQNKIARTASLILIGILLACSLGIYAGRHTDFVKNLPGINRLTTISASEGTGQARLWNWAIAWQGVKERPVFGWGQSNYNFAFDKYYDPKMFEQEAWFDRTHNIVLDWLIAGGFVGLLAYMSIFISLIWAIIRKYNGTVLNKSILLGLLCAYGIHNFFVFDHTVSYLLLGIIIAYVYSQSTVTSAVTSIHISSTIMRSVIAFVIVLTPYAVYAINYSGLVSARELISAIQLFKQKDGVLTYYHENGIEDNITLYTDIIARDTYANPEVRMRLATTLSEVWRIQNIPADIKTQLTEFTHHELQVQMAEVPHDARYPYMLASSYASMGKYEDAISALHTAIELSPQKQLFHFMLARLYLAVGDTQSALESATYAYELAPQFDSAWSQYVTVAGGVDTKLFQAEIDKQIAMGKFDRVEKIILEQIKKTPDNFSGYVSLSALYFQMNDIKRAVDILNQAIEKFPQIRSQLEKLKGQIERGENPVGKTI